MQYLCLLVFIIFISSSSYAGNHPQAIGKSKITVIYQSPADGAVCVRRQTTLIIRPHQAVAKGWSTADFSFNVLGELSGVHRGKVLISDDDETIIFKPYEPFTLGEHVEVTLKISNSEVLIPFSYSFRITSISDQEQNYWLNVLRESEKKESVEFVNKIQGRKSLLEIQSSLNDTVPFPPMTIDTLTPDKVAPGNIFLAPNGQSTSKFSFLSILNNSGLPLFARDILPIGAENFRPWPNNTLSYFRIDNILPQNIFLGQICILDENHVLIDSFVCGNGFITDPHEFQFLPNGHVIVISYDMRDTVIGDSTHSHKARVIGGVIQELDLQKNVVFQWQTWDHFKISDVTHADLNNYNVTIVDYAHLNSVELDNDGNFLASFRAMDEVTKINRKNGNVIWRLGGKNNYFTFIGDTLQFSHQHDVRRIANGNITLWDNGNYHSSVWADGSYHDTTFSRAIEYTLDESNLTARNVWQYSDLPYSDAGGNMQRLANGNTVIGLGNLGAPNVIEVTRNGEKVFQLSMPIGTFNYRSFRFEFPQRSVISLHLTAHTFEFRSVYPNPAANLATIIFSAADPGVLQIDFVNILGQTISSRTEKITEAGTYSLALDVHDQPNGMYYCKLLQNGQAIVKPLIIRK